MFVVKGETMLDPQNQAFTQAETYIGELRAQLAVAMQNYEIRDAEATRLMGQRDVLTLEVERMQTAMMKLQAKFDAIRMLVG